ncbi:MAG: DUF1343 domain-containing protein [Desulfobulbaceae bacterium]|nr:DUF1343 domain-containing protein [Desulfobulbaceae bacterium]
MISLGIEEFTKTPPPWLKNRRLGLLCNQASVNRHFQHSRDLIDQVFPGQLRCLFTPQHGFFAEKQDNMIESAHGRDEQGRPVFSLYGDTRRPDEAMFDHLDVLLVDIFDVGTRVYTFMSTLAYCLEEAARFGKAVLILDRPNPIGGSAIEGNILHDDCRSFVGIDNLPMRHGLTFAELGLLLNAKLPQPAELSVLPMAGWQREMHFPACGQPWIFPSPNMPTYTTALTYPGQVIWEGTNISEGRGTALPFELFGAPFIEHRAMRDYLQQTPLPGCTLRPVCFEPTSNKWQSVVCTGFQIHVDDPHTFLPYRTSLAILGAIMTLSPDHFQLKEPPYEYEFVRTPLDLILGDSSIRHDLAAGRSLLDLEAGWRDGLAAFTEVRQPYLLY